MITTPSPRFSAEPSRDSAHPPPCFPEFLAVAETLVPRPHYFRVQCSSYRLDAVPTVGDTGEGVLIFSVSTLDPAVYRCSPLCVWGLMLGRGTPPPGEESNLGASQLKFLFPWPELSHPGESFCPAKECRAQPSCFPCTIAFYHCSVLPSRDL